MSSLDQRGIRFAEKFSEDVYNAEHGFPDVLSSSVEITILDNIVIPFANAMRIPPGS